MNTLILWVIFHVFVFGLLLFDLGLIQHRIKDMTVKTAL